MAESLQRRLEEALHEKSAAEEQLRDLRERVANAQRLAHMGDYDWEITTDTNTWSDELFRIYGLEPGTTPPGYERFLSFVHPEDRERIQGIHQQAYATGEPYEMIERIVRADGEVRYLASNGQVITDAEGTAVRLRGTCIDITERIRAEQEREAEAARAHAEMTRRQTALELNDTVVQGLTAALYALELRDVGAVQNYVARTLDAARAIVTDLVNSSDGSVTPGDLVRKSAADLSR